MNVLLKQNAAAFDNITYLLDNRIEGSTWYREGSQGSCTETPYAGAWAVVDWYVQSWNTTQYGSKDDGTSTPQTVVDFFPGVDDVIQLDQGAYVAAPARAAAGAFWGMATEGGVLASGKRAVVSHNETHFESRTELVAVESMYGGAVVVRTNMERPLAMEAKAKKVQFKEIGDGGLVQIIGLLPGDGATLYSTKHPTPVFSITPVTGCSSEFNGWGGMPAGGASAAAWPCL